VNASRYYIPVPALWVGLGVKPPYLIRTWRDPLSFSTLNLAAVPLLGPRLGVLRHTVVTWRRLGPLRRELGDVPGGGPRGPRPCRQIPVCPATPCTLPHCLKGVGGAPTRRTGHRPEYVQYEGLCPARREHAPDAAGPALWADDGNLTTGPGGRRGPGCRRNPVISAHGVPPRRPVPPPEAPRRATAPLAPSGRRPIPRTSPEGRQV
jgi:hypothetical protein